MLTIRDFLIHAYKPWKIEFPVDSFKTRTKTHFLQAGWTIDYQFGFDEKGEYVEVYATHRMTSDSHFKVYKDESVVSLPAFGYTYVMGHEDEMHEWNEKVKKDVYDKDIGVLRDK